MSTPAEFLELAIQHHRMGELEQADKLYRSILMIDGQHADAWHLLGVIADQRGDAREAEQCIERAIRLNPACDAYFHNLGEVCRRAGKLDRAIECFRKSLALSPDSAETLACLGDVFRLKRQWDVAFSCCRRAAELDPSHVLPLVHQGHILRDLGRVREALAQYRTALERDPNALEAWIACGKILCEEHPEVDPGPLDEHRFDEADRCFREVLQRQPKNVSALTNLASLRLIQGELPAADEYFRTALEVAPWDRVLGDNRLMLLNYDPQSTPRSLLAEHRAWAQLQPLNRDRCGHVCNPQEQRPLRVGYVSADLRRHPIARFVEPLLRHHDPARVQPWLYADLQAGDEVTSRLSNYGGVWRTIVDDSDQDVATRIQADAIDILVDLAGHTAKNRLGVFARRPAPIQVTYLGYPCTTGLSTIDYWLTDELLDPPDEEAFAVEEPLRIDDCFCCYEPPGDAPPVTELPARQRGYVTFGSLHHLAKLNDQVLDVWAEVLRRLPTARLLLSRHTLAGSICQRLHARFGARGIEPGRIELRADFTPENSHFPVYGKIDISLDAFPWSGHTTACESLWMGVPIVTLRGARHAGRMVASVLTAAGYPQWVAEDPAQYIKLAEMLACDLATLQKIRSELRQRVAGSKLCDGPGFTRNLETVYHEIWTRQTMNGNR